MNDRKLLIRFVGRSKDLELTRQVSKGDFVGHPFRGNQWSDSSGASQGGASSASSQEEIPLLVGVDTVAEANRTGRPLAMMQPENYSPKVKALVKANEQASSLMKEMIQTATEKGNVGLALADPRYGICEAALRITSFEAKRQFQTEYALKHGLELLPPLGEDEYDQEEYRYEELGRNEDGRLTRDDEEIRPAELTGSYEASQRKLGFGVEIDANGKPQLDIKFGNDVFDQVTIRDLIDPKSKHTWNWNDKLDQEEANKSFRTQIYAEAKKVGIDLPDLPPFARFTAKPLLADGKMTEDDIGLLLAHIKKVGFNFQSHKVNDSADAVGRREDFGTAQATLDNQISEVTPDVKLSVAVPANRVGAILKDGRLKTQFETGTSGGRNVRATREDWEATMFGYQRGMDDALRPIYGMVETGGTKPSSARGNEFYGTVVLVLKDSVKERATFTDGDSLYLNDKHVPVNDASSRLAGKPSSARTLAQKSTGYYETQIHGGVSTSDIERVIIDTSNYKDYEWTEKAPSAALLKSLDKAKIPYEIRQGHPPEASKSRFKPTVLIKSDCPLPTQSIKVNLRNRLNAVEVANYGPMNPDLPNTDFWEAKAKLFKTTTKVAKTALCGNCSAFIQTTKMLDCIEQGIDSGVEGELIVSKADLGYCELFDFKCASRRTCDAWLVGGPIVDGELPKPKNVEKGDFVGHPFRGNQWSDSSGASTQTGQGSVSDLTSSDSARLITDRQARTIAADLMDKMDIVADAGAIIKIGEPTKEALKAYNDQLEMKNLSEQKRSQQRTQVLNGINTTEAALNDEGTIVVIADRDNQIVGALSMQEKPDFGSSFSELSAFHAMSEVVQPTDKYMLMYSAGSTGQLDGVGSTLFGQAVLNASRQGSGLYLTPLNQTALEFWEKIGFKTVDAGQEFTKYQYLDAGSVKAIADNLDDPMETE